MNCSLHKTLQRQNARLYSSVACVNVCVTHTHSYRRALCRRAFSRVVESRGASARFGRVGGREGGRKRVGRGRQSDLEGDRQTDMCLFVCVFVCVYYIHIYIHTYIQRGGGGRNRDRERGEQFGFSPRIDRISPSSTSKLYLKG